MGHIQLSEWAEDGIKTVRDTAILLPCLSQNVLLKVLYATPTQHQRVKRAIAPPPLTLVWIAISIGILTTYISMCWTSESLHYHNKVCSSRPYRMPVDFRCIAIVLACCQCLLTQSSLPFHLSRSAVSACSSDWIKRSHLVCITARDWTRRCPLQLQGIRPETSRTFFESSFRHKEGV